MTRQGHGPRTLPARSRVYHRCSCGRPIPEGVRRCSARTCPEFAPIWARDTRRRLLENLRIVPLTVMFSVTAPGADLYPFDPRFCSHRPGNRCSGSLGCRVDPEIARAFNLRAGKWWSELHRAAKVRADRATGHKGKVLARVWEKQKRGLGARAWGDRRVDANRASLGQELRDGSARPCAAQGLRLRRRVAQDRAQALAGGASRRVLVELLRERPGAEGTDN